MKKAKKIFRTVMLLMTVFLIGISLWPAGRRTMKQAAERLKVLVTTELSGRTAGNREAGLSVPGETPQQEAPNGNAGSRAENSPVGKGPGTAGGTDADTAANEPGASGTGETGRTADGKAAKEGKAGKAGEEGEEGKNRRSASGLYWTDRERLPVLELTDFTLPKDLTPFTDSGVSADAEDYADTGGTAQGTMHIDSTIPEGCVNLADVKGGPGAEGSLVTVPEKYTYDRLYEDLRSLKEIYPEDFDFCGYGPTPDGRWIYVAFLGNRQAEHFVMLTGAIHGREDCTANLVMLQLEYLMKARAQNAAFDGKSLKEWLQEVCFVFVPMCNPDGVSVSQNGTGGIGSQVLKKAVEAAVRNDRNDRNDKGKSKSSETKTGSLNLSRWKANARGVNLNQNFQALWSRLPENEGRTSASAFKGETPCSEPETKILTMLADCTEYSAAVHYHAAGSVIYWDIANNKRREHSRDLANNIRAVTGYPLLVSDDGGGYKDYFQLKETPAASVTVEIGTGSAPLEAAQMMEIWKRNRLVPFYVMKWAAGAP